MSAIRPILLQLATALSHLKGIGIIHADIKPENIMIVDHQEPLRVKLIIDFGIACHVSEVNRGSVVQSLRYRSSEVLYGLPFTEAIDMWSVGCVAAELLIGCPLYPAQSKYDMIRYIGQTQGQLPDHLINLGLYSSEFFNRDTEGSEHLWSLKTQVQVCSVI
ncbi:homeodomain-interacting protein kinase 2-like [Myripristis murdjan]|uniref:homeodomain-interacting protein kinase 2-like n=1 Tax=Myripristis murdjan TaxID=586833 RepID=UPI001175F704|nr:homeodomain-interacting protein kinase 2-like [Myripristis murdjan]